MQYIALMSQIAISKHYIYIYIIIYIYIYIYIEGIFPCTHVRIDEFAYMLSLCVLGFCANAHPCDYILTITLLSLCVRMHIPVVIF